MSEFRNSQVCMGTKVVDSISTKFGCSFCWIRERDFPSTFTMLC